jgi:hypothetical protein
MADSNTKEFRANLVANLNAISNRMSEGLGIGEELSPRSFAGILKSAADVIEEQDKIKATDAYLKSIDKYRLELENALEIAQDPFKAPELVVETDRAVMVAAWDMRVEYAAMVYSHKRKIEDGIEDTEDDEEDNG